MACNLKSLIYLDCILLLLCSLQLGIEAGRCPRVVEKEARRCMSKMGAYTPHETLLNMLAPAQNGTKQLCRDGKIQLAFSCLNKLYSSCAKSRRGMKSLKMMVDVDHWRNAIDYMCNSLPRLNNIGECETQAKLEYEPCARRAKASFQRQFDALRADIASMHMTRQQRQEMNKAGVDMACQLTKDILTCLRDPFEKFCSREIAVIMGKTIQAFIPPACAKIAMQRSVTYLVETQRPNMGGSRHGNHDNYPDVVDVVQQGDGNHNNNNHNYNGNMNNKNRRPNGDQGKGKSRDYSGKTRQTSSNVDDELDSREDNENGKKKTHVDETVLVGNAAKVRGKDNNGGGDGTENKDGEGGASGVVVGLGSLVTSLIFAVVMIL